MEKLPELVEALEEAAKTLQATARRLRKEKSRLVASADLAEADRALLELHHRIVHLLGDGAKDETETPAASGEIGVDELTTVLYRTINPPESRRNYTYTPPFSIEKVLRAYLKWINGPGKNVQVKS